MKKIENGNLKLRCMKIADSEIIFDDFTFVGVTFSSALADYYNEPLCNNYEVMTERRV